MDYQLIKNMCMIFKMIVKNLQTFVA